MRTKRDGVAELLRVVDAVDVENADADPVGADPEPNVLARQVVLGEELVERLCERGNVAHLAADDDAWLERFAGDAQKTRAAVVDDLGSREL